MIIMIVEVIVTHVCLNVHHVIMDHGNRGCHLKVPDYYCGTGYYDSGRINCSSCPLICTCCTSDTNCKEC